eukprot:198455_1
MNGKQRTQTMMKINWNDYNVSLPSEIEPADGALKKKQKSKSIDVKNIFASCEDGFNYEMRHNKKHQTKTNPIHVTIAEDHEVEESELKIDQDRLKPATNSFLSSSISRVLYCRLFGRMENVLMCRYGHANHTTSRY